VLVIEAGRFSLEHTREFSPCLDNNFRQEDSEMLMVHIADGILGTAYRIGGIKNRAKGGRLQIYEVT